MTDEVLRDSRSQIPDSRNPFSTPPIYREFDSRVPFLVILLRKMPYRRFEELPVWQDAADLARATFELTSDGLFRPHAGLRNQLERASVSVSNNIAEGFERGSNNELLAFLYIARGSAGETRSMLRVLEKWDIFQLRRKQLGDLTRQCENISRQLYRWIEQIKRSGFRGQRHLNITLQSPSSKVKARDTGGEIDLKSRR